MSLRIPRFAGMGPPRPLAWRRSRFGTNAEHVARALLIASTIYVLFLLLAALLMPFQKQVREIVSIPERQVTVLMDEPEAQAPPAPPPLMEAPEQVAVRQVADPPMPEGIVNEPHQLPTPLRERERPVDPDAGKEGRRRAEEATAQLASATSALDNALGDLSSSLRDSRSGTPEPSRRRRARRVGGGRDDAALAGVDAGSVRTGDADLANSGVQGSIVAIGSLAPARAEAGGFEAEESRSGSAPGVYRSNASLLSVIQRYAAGIQFCYETELNKQPGLRGKLVVAIAVAPSGEVAEATIVQNTLGSSRIASCALSQIRQWKFPPISGGVTTFQTPFVFTPPS